MRGQWLAAVARRLFSPESFALLVEPAIADLQLENSGRVVARMDAYRTVWIGMAAACDLGLARRTRAFVRDNDLVTLAGLALLHAAHSTWMVVLLLGLDDRAHLGRMLSQLFASLGSPAILAIASALVLVGGRALVRRVRSNMVQMPSVVRIGE
jgi:hypothetical protein